MGVAVVLLVLGWLGIAAWAMVWALRSRREQSLADAETARAADAAFEASGTAVAAEPLDPPAEGLDDAAQVDLTARSVDLTARQQRVDAGGDDPRRG